MILHIPHASTIIPAEVRDQFVLDDEALRRELLRMTDAYTDELFDVPEPSHQPDATNGRHRYRKLTAKVSRLVVDVERFPDDRQEPMAARGMGAVYTQTADDGDPLRRSLAAAEREMLMQNWYVPHHDALSEIAGEELETEDEVLIVDCHSFPKLTLPCDLDQTVPRPDFCVGTDSFHTPKELIQTAMAFLESSGYRTLRNVPYKGSLVPLEYYQQEPRVQSIMIEVRRDLYMDEETGEKNDSFDETKRNISRLLELLAAG